MALGLYISVPFCRTKCTYCNFASDVFSQAIFDRYVDRVVHDLQTLPETAARMGLEVERDIDSIYFGGGTPTLLASHQVARLFVTIRQNFRVSKEAEITVECAPGTLTPSTLEMLLASGVNRVSLGVQSFVDQEAAAVGRLHERAIVLDDIARLRAADLKNINVDLIAGLPHQTAESWDVSLDVTLDLGVPHVSVYMLEVDEDSRLGRELIAGGNRYHAHFVPDDDLTAELYLRACERLERAEVRQYEISNFSRAGSESQHNLKYWTRQPYLGFGVDAHSMLPSRNDQIESVRLSTADSLDRFIAGTPLQHIAVSEQGALEESFFLGLRLVRGVDLEQLEAQFGANRVDESRETIADCMQAGLLVYNGTNVRLTPRGRLLSNEVFVRFVSDPCGAGTPAPVSINFQTTG
jgi:oxygen-independent coproporphyrinogen-3 oxidase